MLSSNTKVSGGTLPFSCSDQSSTWLNLNTRSLPKVSCRESLVQVSLPRIPLAFRNLASVLLGLPRPVSCK